MESSFGRAFPRFYIRGLGNTDFDLNASQPVSMVVDDVVLENPVVKGMPLFDLERSRCCAARRARSSAATPRPASSSSTPRSRRRTSRHVRVSYGTFDTTDVMAAVGGGLTETLSARASVLYQYQTDWVDNGFTGEKDALGGYDTTAYRLQLLCEPNDEFSALFNLHGWDLDGTARIFRANILKPGTQPISPTTSSRTSVFQDGQNKQEISAYGGVSSSSTTSAAPC